MKSKIPNKKTTMPLNCRNPEKGREGTKKKRSGDREIAKKAIRRFVQSDLQQLCEEGRGR